MRKLTAIKESKKVQVLDQKDLKKLKGGNDIIIHDIISG